MQFGAQSHPRQRVIVTRLHQQLLIHLISLAFLTGNPIGGSVLVG
jgi:hypothetical protein